MFDIASRNPAADFNPRYILAAARTVNRARVDEMDLPELLAKMNEYNGDAMTRFALKRMACAVTSHSFQGLTAHRVLINIDTKLPSR